MRRTLRRKLSCGQAEAGYTLTEMLVVIGIICLIAAVLTPNVMGQLARARVKTAQLQLQTVGADLEAFRSDVGRYPTTQEGLQALLQQPSSADGWSGPYARDAKALNDPWNRPLVYSVDDSGQTYQVKSLGADGKPGGSGVDRDLVEPPQ
ncbi:MAG: type II secretion system major pseudopilin GspG [Caulobacteraceae bacterium]|nr:type II secretion system major pseudopilin GspG [Caulobacteraceae bacterium]